MDPSSNVIYGIQKYKFKKVKLDDIYLQQYLQMPPVFTRLPSVLMLTSDIRCFRIPWQTNINLSPIPPMDVRDMTSQTSGFYPADPGTDDVLGCGMHFSITHAWLHKYTLHMNCSDSLYKPPNCTYFKFRTADPHLQLHR